MKRTEDRILKLVKCRELSFTGEDEYGDFCCVRLGPDTSQIILEHLRRGILAARKEGQSSPLLESGE